MAAITVANVMTEGAESVAPDVPVRAVARRLREADVGSVLVAGDDGPAGIVTATDLVDLLAGEGPVDGTARDVMSSPVVTIGPDASVGAAVRRMGDTGASTLPVVDDGAVVGVVTTHDLAHYVPQVAHRASIQRTEGPTPTFAVRPDTAYEHDDWTVETLVQAEGAVSVGDRVSFGKSLSEADVRAFAEASGDTNRLHLDEAYADETRFGGRIAHGTLVAGLISAALARLPGLTIYLSQDLSFRGPVPVGATATATCEVVEDIGDDRYLLTTDVHAGDDLVVEGEAVVLVDEVPAVRGTD